MRYNFLFILGLLSNVVFCQHTLTAVVANAETHQPLEFVDVFNSENYTATNSDGKFKFTTSKDSVFFHRLGYHKKSYKIIDFQLDTLFLTASVENLATVRLADKTLYQQINDRLPQNYPTTPYNSNFFLRGIIRRNDSITKLVDLNGSIRRKALFGDFETNTRPKKNYKVNIQHIRKAEIRKQDLEFVLFDLEQVFNLLSRVIAKSDSTETEILNIDDTRQKLRFVPSENEENIAYYIVNKKDKAIEELYLKLTNLDSTFIENRDVRSKSNLFTFHSFFSKKKDKYVLSKGIIQFDQDVIYQQDTSNYKGEYYLLEDEQFNTDKVRQNVSASKDIFKIRKSYKKHFWNSQNQLLLTEEMKQFIEQVKNKDSQFRVLSNF